MYRQFGSIINKKYKSREELSVVSKLVKNAIHWKTF
jgi:hypothetical protein